VRSRIVIGDRAVAAASHDMPIAHNDRTDRNFTERESSVRFPQRFFHEQFVGLRHEGEG